MNEAIIDGVVNSTTPLVQGSMKNVGKEDFLKLLVTQLQHQDPLQPMDNTEFVAQLAQFSTLEGITNMDSRLGSIGDSMLSLNNFGAAGLIGSEITALGDIVTLNGSSAEISYQLQGDASSVTVAIVNSNGSLVRQLETGGGAAGENSVVWDGRDGEGNVLPQGNYTFSVTAARGDGSDVGVDTLLRGVVDEIEYENGAPFLLVGGQRVGMGAVVSVGGI
ncbi:MAG: flagellar hook assembly protein FlgD [Thermodesulfobacteriota bacterium]